MDPSRPETCLIFLFNQCDFQQKCFIGGFCATNFDSRFFRIEPPVAVIWLPESPPLSFWIRICHLGILRSTPEVHQSTSRTQQRTSTGYDSPAFLRARWRRNHLCIFTAASVTCFVTCSSGCLPAWHACVCACSSEMFRLMFCGDRRTWFTGILCFRFWNAFSKSSSDVLVPGDIACDVILFARLFSFWDFPSWEFNPRASRLKKSFMFGLRSSFAEMLASKLKLTSSPCVCLSSRFSPRSSSWVTWPLS